MITFASTQEVFDAFRWNDASSVWVMLGVSFLFHLYTRFIIELQGFSRCIAGIFCFLYISSLVLALKSADTSFIESPLLPTVIFSVVWFGQFFLAVRRFRKRACPQCSSPMQIVSTEEGSLFRKLREFTKVLIEDLWFCPRCQFARTSMGEKRRRCPSCAADACVLDAVTVLVAPTVQAFGAVRLVSECRACSARLSERTLIAPLALGSFAEREKLEAAAVKKLDRIELQKEFWNQV